MSLHAWICVYAVAGIFTAAAALAVAYRRSPDTPSLIRPLLYAAVSGLLWPLLVLGGVQFACIVLVRRAVLRSGRRFEPALVVADVRATPSGEVLVG